jgi:hypothetical protein
MDGATISNPTFALIAVRRINQHNFLTKRDVRGEHQERAVCADGHSKRLFAKIRAVARLPANNHRNVHQYAGAATLSHLRQWILPYLSRVQTTISQISVPWHGNFARASSE